MDEILVNKLKKEIKHYKRINMKLKLALNDLIRASETHSKKYIDASVRVAKAMLTEVQYVEKHKDDMLQ